MVHSQGSSSELLLLVAVAVVVLGGHPSRACTSYIVSPGASVDGSVLIARNDDGEGAVSPSSLVYHPAREKPAIFRANLNSFSVVLPRSGLAYHSLPAGPLADAASGRNISGEAAGWNGAGVAVSATESIYNSAAALAADPFNEDTGIIEDAIPSVLLPQATSAKHAMQLLGGLVTDQGAGEAFGVLAADDKEVWYLETASGHHWLAQRVPHHSFFISANQGRFQKVDLNDSNSALASPGLLDFAISAGLYDPAAGAPFNFFSAFMRDGPHDINYSYPRVCMLQHLFGGFSPSSACTDMRRQPTFLRPSPHKLGVRDIKAAMRNHWDGTMHDPYLHQNPDEPWRPIALLRTGMGHVTQVRPAAADLPDPLSIITHVALATPKLSPFIPLYKGLPGNALPPELTASRERRQPDGVSLFWRARRLQALVFQDWRLLASSAAAAIVRFEQQMEEELCPAFEKRYAHALAKGGEAEAQRQLAAFTQRVVQQAGALLDRLSEEAARQLGLTGVPSDDVMLEMLEAAAEAYAFEPTSDDLAEKVVLTLGTRAVPGATLGPNDSLSMA